MTQRNTMNDRMIQPGTDTLTYNMGKVVPVRIVEATVSEDPQNIYGPKYKVRYTGDCVVCLDFGQDWFLTPGDLFVCYQNNIEAALKDRGQKVA